MCSSLHHLPTHFEPTQCPPLLFLQREKDGFRRDLGSRSFSRLDTHRGRCVNFFSAQYRLRLHSAPRTRRRVGNQDWNYSDQQRRRSAFREQSSARERHTTASSTLKETIMHARVPIAPEMTRPSPTPPSPPGGNLTTVRRSPQRLTFTELRELTRGKLHVMGRWLRSAWPAASSSPSHEQREHCAARPHDCTRG